MAFGELINIILRCIVGQGHALATQTAKSTNVPYDPCIGEGVPSPYILIMNPLSNHNSAFCIGGNRYAIGPSRFVTTQ